ncbi:MAG: type IV pilin N-terminal domain-containing protein [Candidatus Thermoplasmatota archaeon]|nr:type IV pilin N-terminal domain-containing protein [Candidatus Thermoplasmatota archaeon]
MRRIKEEDAVSEVVGTILVLAITIVLFAAVFVYVQAFPLAVPPKQVTIDSEISYDPSSHILYENLSDMAGSPLLKSETFLLVMINGVEHSIPLSSAKVVIISPGISNYIEPGDKILWNFSPLILNSSDTITVSSYLYYKPSNQILWQTSSYISGQISIGALYLIPSQIGANSSFTVIVQVDTFDPNATTVSLNLSSLYGFYVDREMSLYYISGNVSGFYYEGISPPSLPANFAIVATAFCGNVSASSELQIQ